MNIFSPPCTSRSVVGLTYSILCLILWLSGRCKHSVIFKMYTFTGHNFSASYISNVLSGKSQYLIFKPLPSNNSDMFILSSFLTGKSCKWKRVYWIIWCLVYFNFHFSICRISVFFMDFALVCIMFLESTVKIKISEVMRWGKKIHLKYTSGLTSLRYSKSSILHYEQWVVSPHESVC